MKRSTRWTTAIAVATLLAVPPAARAQAPAPTTAPSQPAQRAADSAEHPASGAEHLRQAEAALNDIPAASLAGPAKARIAELKRHINNLDKSAGFSPSARSATPRGANWGTEVAAVDRILSELLGPEGATGGPVPTGTSGTTRSKMGTAITLDDTTRSKLQDVRTHITAFAASMSNTPGAPGAESSAAAAPREPSASAAANAPAAAAAAPAQPQPPTPTAETPAPARSPATPPEPAPAAAQNPQSPQPAAPSASPAPAQSAQQVDPATVKRYLTAARNSLSELTQLPAAAQLSGDARAQVSQLITNFNELITTNTDWKVAYAKVQANLNTLIGDQRTDESPAPAAGAAGAVGTSGTVTLDPAIRSKLVEFRTHLMEFEKAASGGAGNSAEPAASPAASSAPTPNEPAANPAASAAQPSAPQTPAEQPQPSTAASNAPRTSATTGAVGTTGTAAATPTPADNTQAPESRASTASSRQSQGVNQSEAMRHIDAIEAILNGRAATGTSGKESKATTPGTLDRAQIEQIKTHLAELRKALNQER